MRKAILVGLIALVISAVAVAWKACPFFTDVDACLDSGGCYDYSKKACRHDVEQCGPPPKE